MNSIVGQATRNTRKTSWKMALAVGALAAMMAGAMPAVALDQQSPDAANDNAANWHAAGAPSAYQPGAYASARPDQPAATSRPHRGFQDYK